MPHIITEPCIGTKDTACVDVCPVDCIYGKSEEWEMLYIHPEECIDCGLCIDACPTAAITEPYVVDSNKCISYATIELRAPELPPEIENKLAGWLYGCDICQDVCPWNRFEAQTAEERFEPREGNVNAELDEILELTPETYAARFRGSAMKRAKLSGLQRNARALISIHPRSSVAYVVKSPARSAPRRATSLTRMCSWAACAPSPSIPRPSSTGTPSPAAKFPSDAPPTACSPSSKPSAAASARARR